MSKGILIPLWILLFLIPCTKTGAQDFGALFKAMDRVEQELKQGIGEEKSERALQIESLREELVHLRNETSADSSEISTGVITRLSSLKEWVLMLDARLAAEGEHVERLERTLAASSGNAEFEALGDHLRNLIRELRTTIGEVAAKKTSASPKSVGVKHGSLNLGGYIQGWYDHPFADDGVSTFRLKRARASLKGKLNHFTTFKFMVGFVNPGLLDAYADLKLFPSTSLRIGQFKPPFSTDWLTSSSKLLFVDRSMIANNTRVEKGRDIGVQACHRIKTPAQVDLTAGVFNGAGLSVTDQNTDKNFVFRGVLRPRKGLELAGNYYTGKTSDADAPEDLSKWGGSARFAFSDGTVGAEYIAQDKADLKTSGYFAVGAYAFKTPNRLFREVEPAVRYEHYDPDTDTPDDALNRITLGVNLYIDGHYTKMQVNVLINGEEADSVDNDEIFAEIQIAF